MKIRFDPEADALYIRLDDTPIIESEEVSPGVILDYDAEDRVVGVEILAASKRLPREGLRRIEFEVAEPAA